MIGRPEWFTYRKFGWGIAPKTWQGYVYVGIFLAIIIALSLAASFLPIPKESITIMISVIVAIILIDTFTIMPQLSKVHDERENLHQLKIERNVSLAAITSMIIIILYQATMFSINVNNGNIPQSVIPFDWELAVILAVMVITKGVSSYWFKSKG